MQSKPFSNYFKKYLSLQFILLCALCISCSTCNKNIQVIKPEQNYYPVVKNATFPISTKVDHKKVDLSTEQLRLTPDSYKSWEACLRNNKNIDVFILSPGDYTTWGIITPIVSGTAQDPKTITSEYFLHQESQDYKNHPYHLFKTKKQVVVEAFNFVALKHWNLKGLIIHGNSNTQEGSTGGYPNAIRDAAAYNTIDYCYFLDICRGAGIRLLNADFNTIQNCVFEQTDHNITGDNIAIQLSAHTNKRCYGNRILNNEIKNWNDGVAVSRHTSEKHPQFNQTGSCGGTIIENNDIYITESLYIRNAQGTYACAENAIDNKQGTKSTKIEDKIYIRKNRMWGFRYSNPECGPSGSAGAAIVLHRDASNTIVENNIIFDCPVGIMVSKPAPQFKNELVENIDIRNNIFYDIKDLSEFEYDAIALYLGRGANIHNNLIVNTEQAIKYRNPKNKNDFDSNVMINSSKRYAIVDPRFEKNKNSAYLTINKAKKEEVFSFYIKQWTAPELKYFYDLPKIIRFK